MKNEKISVLCLQETHSSNICKWNKSLGFKNGFWSHGTTNSRGVCVLWKDSAISLKKSWRDTEGRIAIVTLEKEGQQLTIGSIYAPNLDPSTATKRQYGRFLQEVEVYIQEARNNNSTIIITGDFNIIRHPTKDNPAINKDATHPYPLALEMFEDFLVNTNLIDGFRALHKNQREYRNK